MAKCMACGKTALLTTNFGNVVLCKNCGGFANVSSWSSREFASIDELMNQRNNAIQLATTNGISQEIIREIAQFFEEYINAGFITSFNGKAGQTIKVFSNHCIVDTKSQGKKTELTNILNMFDYYDEDNDDGSIISADDKKNAVKGLMSGKLVQTGIGFVVSATLNRNEKEKAAVRKLHERVKNTERLITVGERRIELGNVSKVEVYSEPNITYGYLKFVPKGISTDNLYDCEYFFFTKRIKQRVEAIRNVLVERIAVIERESQAVVFQTQTDQIRMTQQAAQQPLQQNKPDVFEEVRKFKQLLDEGIVSEEEFNLKKKELLGL